MGYVTERETATDQLGEEHTVFALRASADRLRNFPADEKYGYAIRMHDEWPSDSEPYTVVFNGNG